MVRDMNGDKPRIYDPIRCKWVVLTPEEDVRQNFVKYLVEELGYPPGRIGNEISLVLNGTRRRCDTVIYGPDANPVALIEYKAPNVPITRETFEQIMRYAIVFSVKWLIVSNGIRNFCAKVVSLHKPHYIFVDRFPTYDEMIAGNQNI